MKKLLNIILIFLVMFSLFSQTGSVLAGDFALAAPLPNHASDPAPQPASPELVDDDIRQAIFDSIGRRAEAGRNIDPNKPMVAVTFDDGPHRIHTNTILDILEKHEVVATFFVLGSYLSRSEESGILLRTFEMGHEIASHSSDHLLLTTLTDDEIHEQISSTNDAIIAVTGQAPRLFRPPYGAANSSVESIAAEFGLPIILWSLDSADYASETPDEIFNRVMGSVQDGSVILLHDIHKKTAEATAKLIPALLKEGYQLVTVSQLFYYRDAPLEPGRVYGASALNGLFGRAEPQGED